MAQNVIPKRSEVPEEFTWNLKDMFESDEAWFAEYEALKEMPARIAAFQGKLGESAETLLESFRLDDEISTRLSRFYGYASCKGDQDTGDNYYQDMRGKAMSTYVAIASAAAYRTSCRAVQSSPRYTAAPSRSSPAVPHHTVTAGV